MRHMIEGGHGNCIAQDNTKVLHSVEDQCNSIQSSISDVSIARRYDLELRQPLDIERDVGQLSNDVQISEYKDAVIS